MIHKSSVIDSKAKISEKLKLVHFAMSDQTLY